MDRWTLVSAWIIFLLVLLACKVSVGVGGWVLVGKQVGGWMARIGLHVSAVFSDRVKAEYQSARKAVPVHRLASSLTQCVYCSEEVHGVMIE